MLQFFWAMNIKKNALEDSNMAIVVYWINSHGSLRWSYVNLLGWVQAMYASPFVVVRHVLGEITSAANFMAN